MSDRPVALLDSNVVIAAVAEAHEHHVASLALFENWPDRSFAVAAHSHAESYAVLTRPAKTAPFRWPPEDAWATLKSVAAVTVLIGLTHGQTFEGIRDYAAGGGTGSRLYDRLIGEAAVSNGIDCIVTWNGRHMSGLFERVRVVDPARFGAAG